MKSIKKYIIILSSLFLLISSLSGCLESESTSTTSASADKEITRETPEIEKNELSEDEEETSALPLSSSECIGLNYQDVKASFKDAGFNSIYLVPDRSDSAASSFNDGEVISVSIGNSDKFEKDEQFDVTESIYINYFSQKVENVSETSDTLDEAPLYSVTAMSAVMYATTTINVRSGPDVSTDKVGSLATNQSVQVVGETDTGWYKIDYNGQDAFVKAAYLSSEKQVVAAPVTSSSNGGSENSDTSTPANASGSDSGSGSGSGATVTVPTTSDTVGNLVWVPTNGGTKYHSRSSCSNMKDPIQITLERAEELGYTPCKRCH